MARPDQQHDTGDHDAVVALDERRLLPRHRRGDPSAFGELLTRYRAPVYGYLVRCGVSSGARDDLFQNIFIKIHNAAATYQADRPLKPWLFTIVANTVRTWYRKQRVQELVMGEAPPDVRSPAPGPQALAEASETAAFLDEAISQLTMAQREAVLLVCVEGLSLEQATKALDLPLGTVKTNLHRGRLALARALSQRNARLARESAS